MIEKKLEKAINQAVVKLFSQEEVLFEIPKNREHGDYSTNIALRIGKKEKKDPLKVALEISQLIEKDSDIERIEVLAPGFINFFLSSKFLSKELIKISEQAGEYGSSQENKTIVIDYSSPNIAKSFGVGHLRSTIIGQAIYNIYSFLGWKCIGDNHLGDWGTQFGKLIYQIREKKLKNSKNRKETLNLLTVDEMEKLYVDFHKQAEINPELENQGRFWFEKLESGDQEAREIWQVCVSASKKEFQRIYDILGVKIDNSFGESFYSEMIPDVVKEMKKKKVIQESEKALIVDFNDEMPSIIVVKSDGATTYLARDLATIKYRIEKWNPDLIVYEVGSDQSLYFQQLFKTAELLKWKKKEEFVHVAHGLVRWKHGKFSTRKGDTIHLEEILNQAIEKSLLILDKSEFSQKEKQEIARMVGIGAVKYNDLSQHYQKDIVFDWDKILNLKGNSGPYLQYTYARCQSVLKKADFSLTKDVFSFEDQEKEVVRELVKFPLIVKEAGQKFSPNILCSFLFDLAQKYNSFYNSNQIIQKDKEVQEKRLIITKAVAQVLSNGLELLGIETPQRM
jgi:arginyl-tRNA synthetase